MDYEESVRYLDSLSVLGTKFGLDRIRFLLAGLNRPDRRMKVIHIAGTNGKGSVCAMLGSVLKEAGYKVGVYTSPHLVDVRERIMINGEMIPNESFAAIMTRINDLEHKMKEFHDVGQPTYFETLTALAFEHFRQGGCDFVVMEVGMGGRLDATNVVSPFVSVITNISMEHTGFLGETIKAIATEKAGIIKKGRPVVTGATGRALHVIKDICDKVGGDLNRVGGETEVIGSSLDGQKVKHGGIEMMLPLLGKFQVDNMDTVIETVRLMRDMAVDIPDEAVEAGIGKTEWPGRIEIVGRDPLVILDCAHNPAGAKALAKFVSGLEYKNLILVTGIMKDKDYRRIINHLKPLASKIIITKPSMERAMDPAFLAANIEGRQLVRPDVSAAMETARKLAKKKDIILAAGSIYLVGDVKRLT